MASIRWEDLDSWHTLAVEYYRDPVSGCRGGDPKTVCNYIARTLLGLEAPDQINWVASRLHEYFLAKDIYQQTTPAQMDDYVALDPIPLGLRVFDETGIVMMLKYHGDAMQNLKALGLGIGQLKSGLPVLPVPGSSAYREVTFELPAAQTYKRLCDKYPTISHAMAYYQEKSKNNTTFRHKLPGAQCLETAREALGYKERFNTEYIASRIYDFLQACHLLEDRKRPTFWIDAKNMWEMDRVIYNATVRYERSPLEFGSNSHEASWNLTKEIIGNKTHDFTAYVASRIFDAFTDALPQIWQAGMTQVRLDRPTWHLQAVDWWTENGVLVRPPWLPLFRDLSKDMKKLVQAHGPPEKLFPDFDGDDEGVAGPS